MCVNLGVETVSSGPCRRASDAWQRGRAKPASRRTRVERETRTGPGARGEAQLMPNEAPFLPRPLFIFI